MPNAAWCVDRDEVIAGVRVEPAAGWTQAGRDALPLITLDLDTVDEDRPATVIPAILLGPRLSGSTHEAQ